MKSLNYLLLLTLFIIVFHSKNAIATSTETLISLARDNMQTKLDDAQMYIEQALELAPEHPEANFLCGRIMGQQASDAFFSALSYAKKSLNCLQKAVTFAPNDVDYQLGLFNFYIGAPRIAGGDMKLAREQVDIIRYLDALAGAKAELILLSESEQTTLLESHYQRYRQQFPNVAAIHLRHGLYLQKQNDYERAYQALLAATQSSQIDDDYYNSLYQLGRNAVFSQAQVDTGIESLLAFVEQYPLAKAVPPLEWAYLRLAQLYQLNNQPDKVALYTTLAKSSSDRDLHRALRNLKD